MIEVADLTKRYGPTVAVDGLSFRADAGKVTGLLGPNGAGKSTTMAAALGLQTPTRGGALVAGRRYAELEDPLRTVGAVLEGAGAHPRHRVRDHLRWLAVGHGIPRSRAEEVTGLVGLLPFASRRVHALSSGLRQRLGIAAALLGDPQVLILDEPNNGLDVDGSRWLRGLVRSMAAEGRTVLISSHVLSEVEAVADHLVVVVGGQLAADTTPAELGGTPPTTRVVSEEPVRLAEALEHGGATVGRDGSGALLVSGMEPAHISRRAADAGVAVLELAPQRRSLEDAYVDLLASGDDGR